MHTRSRRAAPSRAEPRWRWTSTLHSSPRVSYVETLSATAPWNTGSWLPIFIFLSSVEHSVCFGEINGHSRGRLDYLAAEAKLFDSSLVKLNSYVVYHCFLKSLNDLIDVVYLEVYYYTFLQKSPKISKIFYTSYNEVTRKERFCWNI